MALNRGMGREGAESLHKNRLQMADGEERSCCRHVHIPRFSSGTPHLEEVQGVLL